jgi:phage FluMu protein gp41
VAAVFTFGREDLIPDMFMPLLERINSKNNELNKLIYYFKRHIEVDGDMHGPMSMEMLTYLCKNDEEKISEAKSISEKALLSRISLWDGIENEIKTKYKYYEKV